MWSLIKQVELAILATWKIINFSILSHLLAELWSDYFICLAIGVISGANSLIVVFDYFFFKAVCFGFRVNFICASSLWNLAFSSTKGKAHTVFNFFKWWIQKMCLSNMYFNGGSLADGLFSLMHGKTNQLLLLMGNIKQWNWKRGKQHRAHYFLNYKCGYMLNG